MSGSRRLEGTRVNLEKSGGMRHTPNRVVTKEVLNYFEDTVSVEK